jgi:uncharacterized membrane protein YsdA (DUF1294 family)
MSRSIGRLLLVMVCFGALGAWLGVFLIRMDDRFCFDGPTCGGWFLNWGLSYAVVMGLAVALGAIIGALIWFLVDPSFRSHRRLRVPLAALLLVIVLGVGVVSADRISTRDPLSCPPEVHGCI